MMISPSSMMIDRQESRIPASFLNPFWELAGNGSLDEEERINALLVHTGQTLDMELVVVGEFSETYLARYVYDTLGILPAGSTLDIQNTLCRHVLTARAPLYIPDLVCHPLFCDHSLLTQAGLHVYAGVPIWGEFSELVGVLALLRRDPVVGDFYYSDIAFIKLVAAWIGLQITHHKQRIALEQQALTDALTGLYNRRAAMTRLEGALANARRGEGNFTLAMCDLDNFKRINDRYGHAVGDLVLQSVAGKLRQGLRSGDWVARWGGEEFLLFIHKENLADAR